eukprot:CAMPEP_0113329836 /NCGR_PEP_ID=MMETSP0010_2-20120614/21187_1 /TAXON_ID=216773 ORGANISM="Corethron hystrix, Strain 308" /NCGR_SAMPLE_ID=MMETSP0010_2 /ASSEMBLY_ACC=CAM_ASM_000155 /LENGTH=184 /DNA_ID=CAMNT_0000192101 /DNA_START=57 /DNA_END=607 /DNA_ORIENTATION=+ /assembly_acc=CAM_ASM_000155
MIPIRGRVHVAGSIKRSVRRLSRGALAGGFTKEGLQRYARRHWKEEDGEPYADLFSQNLSAECSEWLADHGDPSGALAKAYFGSPRFVPERRLLRLFFDDAELPAFGEDDAFLAWTVTSKTPHEIICSWEFRNCKGLTTMAVDTRSRKVFHGNCIDTRTSNLNGFGSLIPLHSWYAKLLLDGMA